MKKNPAIKRQSYGGFLNHLLEINWYKLQKLSP